MDDTKDTKDIKETGEAASVLSADESRKLLISLIKRTPE